MSQKYFHMFYNFHHIINIYSQLNYHIDLQGNRPSIHLFHKLNNEQYYQNLFYTMCMQNYQHQSKQHNVHHSHDINLAVDFHNSFQDKLEDIRYLNKNKIYQKHFYMIDNLMVLNYKVYMKHHIFNKLMLNHIHKNLQGSYPYIN